MELIDRKRAAVGLAPLTHPVDEGFDKSSYMREFMAQKRARLVRAAELENAQRPERDRLIGRHRLDFMDRLAAEWKIELDELFARSRAANGKRLPKDIVTTLRAQFWASIDKRLDDLEEQVKRRRL